MKDTHKITTDIEALFDEEADAKQHLANIRRKIFEMSLEYWKEKYKVYIGATVYVGGVPARITHIFPRENYLSRSLPTVRLLLQKSNGDYVDYESTIPGTGPFAYTLEPESEEKGAGK